MKKVAVKISDIKIMAKLGVLTNTTFFETNKEYEVEVPLEIKEQIEGYIKRKFTLKKDKNKRIILCQSLW